jgi:hypothetical protein
MKKKSTKNPTTKVATYNPRDFPKNLGFRVGDPQDVLIAARRP